MATVTDQRLEIRKCDGPTNGPTNQLTWVGARDTCVSKKGEFQTYSAQGKVDGFFRLVG